MPTHFQSSHCAGCDEMLDEPPGLTLDARTPCPRCGSLGRKHVVGINSTLHLYSKAVMKARRAAGGKPYQEQIVGSDLHRKSGIWMRYERLIDRARNWYREHVTNPTTGQVVHHCEEPLSEHRGHGSDGRSRNGRGLRTP